MCRRLDFRVVYFCLRIGYSQLLIGNNNKLTAIAQENKYDNKISRI